MGSILGFKLLLTRSNATINVNNAGEIAGRTGPSHAEVDERAYSMVAMVMSTRMKRRLDLR
jgi:hypothetical protein